MSKITVKKIDTVRKLNFLERIWLPEILRGIWITNRHFVVNMFFHTLNFVGIRTRRKGAVTIQYPEEHRGFYRRLRTRHYLACRADGQTRCVGCMMCETVCPAGCIRIVAGEAEDPLVEKKPQSFTIDMGRCIFCGYCVEVCPEDAIRMDSGDIEICSYTRDGMICDLENLTARKHEDRNYKKENRY
ncbi:MAG: NADH-quinone oxidoreductase subunit I [Gemmatimonadota bacterium]|nr:NADH-quinone oxidoreductase subunit I [Gemmatimonadota bacterium]